MTTAASMRIVVWNCKMAFSRKWQFFESLSPDIAVIPECSKNSIDGAVKYGFDGRWFGDKPQKGLGVLVAKPWGIVESKEPQNKWIVPLQIGGPANSFLLLCGLHGLARISKAVISFRFTGRSKPIQNGSMGNRLFFAATSTATPFGTR